MSGQTPGQTIGPFFHPALGAAGPARVPFPDDRGDAIVLTGGLYDGAGAPVADGLIELWQPDREGQLWHPEDAWPPTRDEVFGFARAWTDDDGQWTFHTVKPGVPAGAMDAPHVALVVHARGLLGHLHTRAYFGDEHDRNATDPTLLRVGLARRATLITTTEEAATHRLDIHLQGSRETVFLDV